MIVGVVRERDVFVRDRWRCQLCGCCTPQHMRGTHADNAPEIDHIVPLAQGGPHTMDNVQCACRRCNHDKGSKWRGQRRLAFDGGAITVRQRRQLTLWDM